MEKLPATGGGADVEEHAADALDQVQSFMRLTVPSSEENSMRAEEPRRGQLLISEFSDDSRLASVLEGMDLPLAVMQVDGLSGPELQVGNRRYWGVSEIARFVEERRRNSRSPS